MYNEDPTLLSYMKSISAYPLIDLAREQELATIIQSSDNEQEKEKARTELIHSNLRLVVKMAIYMYRNIVSINDMNLSVMDLIQAGNIALIKSANKYKTNSSRFFSYAFVAIERNMKIAVRKSKFIQLPADYFKYSYQIRKMQEEKGTELTDEEISEYLKIPLSSVTYIRQNNNYKVSLDELIEEKGDIEDVVSCPEDNELKDYLIEKINELSPYNRDILLQFFFRDDIITLKQLGDTRNVSKQAIRSGIQRAICKLKRKIDKDKDKDKFLPFIMGRSFENNTNNTNEREKK